MFSCCHKNSVSVIEQKVQEVKNSEAESSDENRIPTDRLDSRLNNNQQSDEKGRAQTMEECGYLVKISFPAIAYRELERQFEKWSSQILPDNGLSIIRKVAGEGRLILVFKPSSPQELDHHIGSLTQFMDPAQYERLQFEATPIISYERFASDLCKRMGSEDRFDVLPTGKPGASEFFLTFKVGYEGMTQDKLFEIWAKEARAAIGGKEKGMVVDLFKATAERKVFAFMNADPLMMDKLSWDLPIMKMMGEKVEIESKSVYAPW